MPHQFQMEVQVSAVHRQTEQSHSHLEKVSALDDLIQVQSESTSGGGVHHIEEFLWYPSRQIKHVFVLKYKRKI